MESLAEMDSLQTLSLLLPLLLTSHHPGFQIFLPRLQLSLQEGRGGAEGREAMGDWEGEEKEEKEERFI